MPSAINLSNNIYIGSPFPIDDKYSQYSATAGAYVPYPSTASACAALPLPTNRYIGLTVLIGTSSTQPYPQEYWWQNGTSDSNLILKQSLATGNITGSASTGYVALWTGTTSVGYTSSLYWNSSINGLIIGTNSSQGTYSLQTINDILINGINIGLRKPGIMYANLAIGIDSLKSIYNNIGYNTAIGNYTMYSNTIGINNTAVGLNALYNNINGEGNIAVGANALFNNNSGNQNTALGYSSLIGNTTGVNNICVGAHSGMDITIGSYNTIIGSYVGLSTMNSNIILSDGNGNIGYKWNGTASIITGPVLIGYTQSQGTYSFQVSGDAYINGLTIGIGKTNINSNTIIGNKTAGNLISASAVNNVFIGYQAAYNISGTYSSTGNSNVVIGANSGYNLQGYENTLIGTGAGYSLTTQYGVVCIGSGAGYRDNAGPHPSYNQNTYIGFQSGYNNVSGQNNTFLGYFSGQSTTGGNNTFVGSSAGYTNTSGTNNVGIGSGVIVIGTNIIAIGAGVSATVSNTVIIGNSSITSTTLYGNVSTNGSITAQTGGFDSDARLKSDIVYNPIIEGIDSIRSASYVIGGNSHIGYIAQEVQNIVPSSIIKKDDGYLALNYNEVLVAKVAFLENKVKELSDIIERNGLK